MAIKQSFADFEDIELQNGKIFLLFKNLGFFKKKKLGR